MGKIVDGLLEEVKALTGAQKKSFAKQIGGVLGLKGLGTRVEASPLGGLSDTGDILEKRLSSRTELFRSQGQAAVGLIDIFGEVEKASIALTGKTEAGMAALDGLSNSMKSLTFIAKDTQVDLVTATMALEEFGVSAGTVGEIMDTAVFSFGMSGTELTKITRQLGEVVTKFPGQARQIAENFRNAQQSLLYDTDTIMEVFGKLQKTSTMTGVSFDRLTNAFGTSMDTFQGSSEKAGRLNAILGKSVFNSIDLLGKTEADRVQTIIDGVKKNVNVESLKKNKFQLQAVAKSLDLTPDETRRLLSGKATVEDVMKGKEDPRAKAQRLMNEALDNNTMSLDQLRDSYLAATKTQLEQATLGMNVQTQDRITKEIKNALDLTSDSTLNTTTDIMERALDAAMATGMNKENYKALKSSMDTLFKGLMSGNLTTNMADVQSALGGIAKLFEGEFKQTTSERIKQDLLNVERKQQLAAVRVGKDVGNKIVLETISPVLDALKDLGIGAGKKDPISAKTLEKMSGVEIEAKKQTEQLENLNKAFTSGGITIKFDKDPATGSLLGTGKLQIDPAHQALQKKTMEAKRRE